MLLTRRAAAGRVVRGGARLLAAGRRPQLQRPKPPSVEAEADLESGLARLQCRDYAGAAEAFERASERGSARGALHAAFALDGLLGGGAGAAPSSGLAADHYQRAAEAGDSTAMCHLALCCRDGRGTARDPALGFAWLELGAASGSDLAQFLAGAALDPHQPPWAEQPWAEEGRGVSTQPVTTPRKDAARAVGFYCEAAAQGHAEARVQLGVALYMGSGTEVDRVAAVELWRRVAHAAPGTATCRGAGEGAGELAGELLDAVARGQGASLETCNPVRQRLQPCATEAATLCD